MTEEWMNDPKSDTAWEWMKDIHKVKRPKTDSQKAEEEDWRKMP